MYEFIDVTETSEGDSLPSEALQINGEFIEDLIPGYRTLHVSGREALSPELDYFETGVRDGSQLKSRRYPARIITVTYQLIAASNDDFRDAYNKLGGILNCENAELIFNDEPDKFFTGTPMKISDIEPGSNAVIGEIEFFCADPFKYSITEYEAVPTLDDGTIVIGYEGTYKSYPTLEAEFYVEKDVADDGETAGTLTGNGDCGYVAFFNENKKIIQIGNPDEADGENAYAKSQTLINQTFETNTAWGSKAKSLWTLNNGVLPTAYNNAQQVGTLAMGVASYTTPSAPENTSGTILKASATLEAPPFNYTVTYKTADRKETSVKVTFAIKAALGRDSAYFGHGLGLQASIYVNGAWKNIKLKDTSEYWKGQSGHTVNLSVTVTGLTSSTTSITGIKFKVTRTDSDGNSGKLNETTCSAVKVNTYETAQPESYYLTCSNYGSASGKWHGASMCRSIPVDAAGDTGATDFTLTYKQKMCIGTGSKDSNQLGSFSVFLSDASDVVVVGVRVYKYQSGNKGFISLYVNDSILERYNIDMSYKNKYFGVGGVQTSSVIKSGSTVTFNIGGYKKTVTNDAIKDMSVRKVTFMIDTYSTNTALAFNGLYWAKFVKNNCDTWRDIPNKFSTGDVIEADCKNGEIYLNGDNTPSLGALGNDWEDFYLVPGINQIGYAYSSWVASGCEPNFKVKYREVYL